MRALLRVLSGLIAHLTTLLARAVSLIVPGMLRMIRGAPYALTRVLWGLAQILGWLIKHSTNLLTLPVAFIIWATLAGFFYWFFSTSWVIVKDFNVASASELKIDGRALRDHLTAELRRIRHLHESGGRRPDPVEVLTRALKGREARPEELLKREPREIQEIAALQFDVREIRALKTL